MNLSNFLSKLKLDKRYVFPIVLAVPIIFITYSIYSLVAGEPETNNKLDIDTTKIQTLPDIDTTKVRLSSKADAMSSSYQGLDYTAIRDVKTDSYESYDLDTTLYTPEELAIIKQIRGNDLYTMDSLKYAEQKQISAEQQKILDILGQGENSNYTHTQQELRQEGKENNSKTDELAKELQMYQKFSRGEPIYTEEEEKYLDSVSNINRIKQSVIDSINNSRKRIDTLTTNSKKQFNSISVDNQSANNTITAIISENTKITGNTRIPIKLTSNLVISGELIPKGTELYAIAQGLSNSRLKATITNIIYKDRLYRINFSIYDVDGQEGLYIPLNKIDKATKEISSQALQNTSSLGQATTINNNPITGAIVQTAQNVYQTTTNAISNLLSQEEINIKYNTKIYLISSNN